MSDLGEESAIPERERDLGGRGSMFCNVNKDDETHS